MTACTERHPAEPANGIAGEGQRIAAPLESAGRLLRLELRRNAMLWLLPLLTALFWFITYRRAMALPPMWNVRAMSMQGTAAAVFVPTIVGAGAWMGSREDRLGTTDLLAGTVRPRWDRQLATWAATTCWAMAAYLSFVGVLYGITASQGAWGGPLWWPVVVGAASLPAFSALGFAAGALYPSRFTAPLIAVAAFFALEVSLQLIHGGQSYVQVLPVVAGPWELGTDEGVATFYRYLPDLPLVQVLFVAGLTATLLGVLGLPSGAGGLWLRRSAALITTAGLLVAGTAVALAGTGRLDAHGMIAILAVHDADDDRPVPYTPVCSRTAIPVCLHPAYALYLPAVAAALEPVLSEVAGLPGAPAQISQAAATYHQGPGNQVDISWAGPLMTGQPPVFHLLLPNQLPGPELTAGQFGAAIRVEAGHAIVAAVIGGDRKPSPAQEAVLAGLHDSFPVPPGTSVAAAAQRFAALPAAARHAWLMKHLAGLRAGQITLADLP